MREGVPWQRDDIPLEHAIIGLGPVTLTVAIAELTKGDYPDILVYATGEGGSGAEVHIETRTDLPRVRLGRGGVHHVAFADQNLISFPESQK